MNTVEPIPGGTVHSPEKRVRPELAAMALITLNSAMEVRNGHFGVGVRLRGQVGIDGDAWRDAVLQRPAEHTLRKEPSLETMTTEVQPVDRAIDAVGKVLAGLCERPMAERAMLARFHAADVVEHFGQTVEVKPSPS
mgnify:CR=1 FL=1